MKAPYTISVEKVYHRFRTGEKGLDEQEAITRLAAHGENLLIEKPPKSRWAILFSQFDDVMIIILILAAGISFFVGESTDAYVILAIILGNAWMGYSQEYQAGASMQMLKKMAAPSALVLRNTHPVRTEASKLVPGDVILLEAGDIIPADARIIEANTFTTDESALTGESFPVEKFSHAIHHDNLMAGDQHNMLFKSTIVSHGSGRAIVTATGMETEIGKIAGLLDSGPQKTPLQKRLARFSRQLAVMVIVISLLVLGHGLLRGEPPMQMFLIALSLAVAALPEALPAVITIALAQGAHRMIRQKALIRKLPAVETLGSVTYICSDKTGTLTQNRMTLEKWHAVEGKEDWLHYAMLLNHDVRFAEDGILIGDSTEIALVHAALHKGYTKEEAHLRFPLVTKLPFNSDRMRMSTLHEHEGRWILLVKGAPAKIIDVLADPKQPQVQDWLNLNRAWASEGLRVLFFAYRILEEKPTDVSVALESGLQFLGMTAIIDPPREEVIDAIHQCKAAGIHTVMITGDQALTARSIARRLDISGDHADTILTGVELEQLDESTFNEKVQSVSVYARVSPEQKLKIVRALQAQGQFVAMTGDGVNDAPSLKQADIGLAMGITGTDVAKEAADMILLDDNFTTIVKAVREGRRIYANIRKFIVYVLSCNLSEILTISLAPVLGMCIPLLPTHILWINLVTDGLPGIALVAEPAEKNIMQRPPRPPGESLFAGGLGLRILVTGAMMTCATLFIQFWAVRKGYTVQTQQTLVFTTLCFVQLGNALSVRSEFGPLLSRWLFQNRALWWAILLIVTLQSVIVFVPGVQTIFKTSPISEEAWWMILGVSLTCLAILEIIKYGNRRLFLS